MAPASASEERTKRKVSRAELGVVTAVTFTIVLWAIWATCGTTIARFFLNGADPEESANWGESFGAFNALISALGFLGVLVTLLLQGRALRQQQSDSISQSQERHRQEFDRTFFQLLELMRNVRSEIFFKYSPAYIAASARTARKTAHGPEALSRAAREVSYWVRKRVKEGDFQESDLAKIYIGRVHSRAEARLGPYYRVIYTILRRISEDRILTREEKDRYGNLVRSQLQSREVLLLALNSLTAMSNDFKDYLVEFRIMKYIRSEHMKQTLLAIGYPEEAFQARD